MQETSLFISYEVLVWVLDKLWGLLINLILLPIAILGLTLDYLRIWARKVSANDEERDAFPTITI